MNYVSSYTLCPVTLKKIRKGGEKQHLEFALFSILKNILPIGVTSLPD